MIEALDHPLPSHDVLTQPFWDACRKHSLAIQRCTSCRRFRFYPTAACSNCASPRCEWENVSGRGTIYSWVVVAKTHDPYWRHHVPYVSAIVELQEQSGLFMPGLLTGIKPSQVQAGMAVRAIFEDVSSTISLPRWRADDPE